jgi:hypothetical protein
MPITDSSGHEFIIGERKFRLRPLKAVQALKGLPLLTGAVVPMIAGGLDLQAGSTGPQTIRMLVGGLERIDEIVALFADRCEVQWETGSYVALPQFLDLVFEGKTADLLEWIIECLSSQYADFLGGGGLVRLVARVSRFASQSGLTGGSGA